MAEFDSLTRLDAWKVRGSGWAIVDFGGTLLAKPSVAACSEPLGNQLGLTAGTETLAPTPYLLFLIILAK